MRGGIAEEHGIPPSARNSMRFGSGEEGKFDKGGKSGNKLRVSTSG